MIKNNNFSLIDIFDDDCRNCLEIIILMIFLYSILNNSSIDF